MAAKVIREAVKLILPFGGLYGYLSWLRKAE